MADREKVLAALKACARKKVTCKHAGCPYLDEEDDCIGKMARDALELLKEQEPVKPDYSPYYQEWYCGNCGKTIARAYGFCNHCGRMVKWDA